MVTLRSLIEAHPEWADLEIVILGYDGNYDFLDASAVAGPGTIHRHQGEDNEDGTPVPALLVFQGY